MSTNEKNVLYWVKKTVDELRTELVNFSKECQAIREKINENSIAANQKLTEECAKLYEKINAVNLDLVNKITALDKESSVTDKGLMGDIKNLVVRLTIIWSIITVFISSLLGLTFYFIKEALSH